MDEQILIYAAILVAVIVLTIVGILSRYRKSARATRYW